jgi:hypothetical protein
VFIKPAALADGVSETIHQEDRNMKPISKFIGLSILAISAGAAGGLALADSDPHERAYDSSAPHERQYRDEERSDRRQDVRQHSSNSQARWHVTSAIVDQNGRLVTLQHMVPVSDMAVFGMVTEGFVANGLKIDRVDAVFNAADVQMSEPHYHFTQTFLASK